MNVYEGNVTFYIPLPSDAAGKPFVADLSMLLCSSRKCMPVNEQVTGVVARESAPISGMPWRIQWQELQRRAPAAPPAPQAEEDGNDDAAGDAWARESAQATTGGWVEEGMEKLPPPDGFDVRLSPRFLDDSMEISGLGKALLFGILAACCSTPCPACCQCSPSR